MLLRAAGSYAWLASSLVITFCIAGRDMLDHGRRVLKALQADDLALARNEVAKIVGRDTGELDAGGVARAAVESVAESLCDGLVAPLCFAALGGAPLAAAYRTVSTLDSMVGYKTERHRELGWASARLDDLLNWLPARLCALLAALASPWIGADPLAALRSAASDGPKQPSPNSGWPEGAFAGALGVQLGGSLSYQGRASHKAHLGQPLRALDASALRRALWLFFISGLFAAILLELLWLWPRA